MARRQRPSSRLRFPAPSTLLLASFRRPQTLTLQARSSPTSLRPSPRTSLRRLFPTHGLSASVLPSSSSLPRRPRPPAPRRLLPRTLTLLTETTPMGFSLPSTLLYTAARPPRPSTPSLLPASTTASLCSRTFSASRPCTPPLIRATPIILSVATMALPLTRVPCAAPRAWVHPLPTALRAFPAFPILAPCPVALTTVPSPVGPLPPTPIPSTSPAPSPRVGVTSCALATGLRST